MANSNNRRANGLRLIISFLMAAAVTAVGFQGVRRGDTDYREAYIATIIQIRHAEAAIEKYRKEHRQAPGSLADLDEWMPVQPDGTVRDGWKRPLVLSKEGDHFRITSLGADGRPGGMGIDHDFSNDDPHPRGSEPTLLQILQDKPSQGAVAACVLCGVVTLVFCLVRIQPEALVPENRAGLAVRLTLTLIGASFAASLITLAHVPKGH